MQDQNFHRFSQLYLERGQSTRDSSRFRNRLASYFSQNLSKDFNYPAKTLYETETGDVVPWVGSGWVFSEVFRRSELRDVLDAITIVYRVLVRANYSRFAALWRDFVLRAMREENVGYTLDAGCVVHYYVDQEFERNRFATVAALQLPQLSAVRAAFEDAYRHLDATPCDTKAAVRSMFEAVETLARLIVPETKNLNRWLAENSLKEKCVAVSGGDAIEKKVLVGLFDGLADWVDALHNYRHGQAVEEPISPSEELAVLALSTGSAYLRQLAGYAVRMAI